MKSFKQHLKESEVSVSPDAPQPVLPTLQSVPDTDNKGGCDGVQRMIDHYRERVEEAQRNFDKALEIWSEACGGSDIDRAVWCAKYCGGGGEWPPGPDGEWLDYECMERCLAESQQHCQDLLDALSDSFDTLSDMEAMLAGYEQYLRNFCSMDVLLKSTRKPDSKKPDIGVTPIEPTTGPNIK